MYESIPERAQILLKTLIEGYIKSGQPLGSRTLVQHSGLQISPATARNVMIDLEEMGLVKAPHTSAGRIPTERGYRVFVDQLLTISPLHNNEVQKMARDLDPNSNLPDLINRASSVLSDVTQLAGVVMLPRRDQVTFRYIEFLPLQDRRILVIWVVNERDVQNRIIEVDRAYSRKELNSLANHLNDHYAGLDLQTIRQRLLNELRDTHNSLNKLMLQAIDTASGGEGRVQDQDYVLDGQSNLLGYAEMADMDKLKQLFTAFREKQELIGLLDNVASAEGVQIFIGEESGYQVFDGCSFVAAPYSVSDEVLGVVGVIGPTRMPYDRVIPVVDATAKILSTALKPQ